MENLAVNHIYLTLGIAGLVSMIVTGCAIEAGDALFKRFQRAAIKRELNKVAKLVAAILLTFSLLTSQLALAAPPSKAAPELQYHRLFAVTNVIMVHMKKICKTDECTSLANEGLVLVADAQEKQKHGSLVGEERERFHQNLTSVLTRVRATLVNIQEKDHVAKLPECPTCSNIKPVVFDEDRCDLCYETFEHLVEICALYLGICETCALICMSTAALQFGNCIRRFCDGT
jgi:hypothetical protein